MDLPLCLEQYGPVNLPLGLELYGPVQTSIKCVLNRIPVILPSCICHVTSAATCLKQQRITFHKILSKIIIYFFSTRDAEVSYSMEDVHDAPHIVHGSCKTT